MVAKVTVGFSSSLQSVLEPDDTSLPINNIADLTKRLENDGDFTTLLIQDTVGYEVVKALNFRGSIALERGLSSTTPKRFPIGSCVTFAPSDELFKALVCETNCCENNDTDTTPPSEYSVDELPKNMVGSINAVLGKPDGFMLIAGKKVPFYN